jgi:hypothetical protein
MKENEEKEKMRWILLNTDKKQKMIDWQNRTGGRGMEAKRSGVNSRENRIEGKRSEGTEKLDGRKNKGNE